MDIDAEVNNIPKCPGKDFPEQLAAVWLVFETQEILTKMRVPVSILRMKTWHLPLQIAIGNI
jgi:hypothetical protein